MKDLKIMQVLIRRTNEVKKYKVNENVLKNAKTNY